MRRAGFRSSLARLGRPVGAGLLLAVVLMGATGLSCDSDAAAAFRQETTTAFGTGVKTILDAAVDGLVAAIEQAGDGAGSSGSSGSS